MRSREVSKRPSAMQGLLDRKIEHDSLEEMILLLGDVAEEEGVELVLNRGTYEDLTMYVLEHENGGRCDDLCGCFRKKVRRLMALADNPPPTLEGSLVAMREITGLVGIDEKIFYSYVTEASLLVRAVDALSQTGDADRFSEMLQQGFDIDGYMVLRGSDDDKALAAVKDAYDERGKALEMLLDSHGVDAKVILPRHPLYSWIAALEGAIGFGQFDALGFLLKQAGYSLHKLPKKRESKVADQ